MNDPIVRLAAKITVQTEIRRLEDRVSNLQNCIDIDKTINGCKLRGPFHVSTIAAEEILSIKDDLFELEEEIRCMGND